MARITGGRNDARSNALWGSGSRPGDSRTNALWGKGGRGLVLGLTVVLAMAVPMAATGKSSGNVSKAESAFVDANLLAQAQAGPDTMFKVIVEGAKGKKGSDVGTSVQSSLSGKSKDSKLSKVFKHLPMASAELSGSEILDLATKSKDISAITLDNTVRLANYGNREKWAAVTLAPGGWKSSGTLIEPAIAIVDSGIDASRVDFGGRVVHRENLSSLPNNSPGDGRGHGTFVASMAAGSAAGRAGIAPEAKLVDVDIMDDSGMARTSDVIGAADWIIANKDVHNIKVANFSLHSTANASVMYDPLDHAVERLWLSGVVVVAAAGNYRTGAGPSGVLFAPANDPWIITVGAVDIKDSYSTNDDVAAPWSAYGYTFDGFAKPDMGAPGRYLIGAVPTASTMYAERPDRIVHTGYMRMSGTSFAAPMVSGAAALIIAKNPTFTPDLVKGALMVSAKGLPLAAPSSVGVGELKVSHALKVTNPPNPNLGLRQFVTTDPATGGLVFDSASWASTARSNASWASASWESASWASASWASASWASASWESASWASASWATASWESASWASASWASQALADSAEVDTGAYDLGTDPEFVAANADSEADHTTPETPVVTVTTVTAPL